MSNLKWFKDIGLGRTRYYTLNYCNVCDPQRLVEKAVYLIGKNEPKLVELYSIKGFVCTDECGVDYCCPERMSKQIAHRIMRMFKAAKKAARAMR